MRFFERDRSDWPRGTAHVLQQRGKELDLEVTLDGETYQATTKYDASPGTTLLAKTVNVRVHPKHKEKVYVESLFDVISDPTLSTESGAQPVQSPPGALQQLLGGLAAAGANVQVVDGGTQVIDASKVPGLREEILAALEQHGVKIPSGVEEGASDPVAQLEKLAELHQRGALTDEQFEAAKKKLLSG
jgi:hypothetical protein